MKRTLFLLGVVVLVAGLLLASMAAAAFLPANRVAGFGAVLQALVVAAAAIFAKGQVDEARRAREARDRPFVAVDFQLGPTHGAVHLNISNTGSTLARNVRMRFDPEVTRTFDESVRLADTSLIKDGIPTLPPGRVISLLFDSVIQRRPPHPDSYEVTLTYEGDRGFVYHDLFVLDIAIYRQILSIRQAGLDDIHKRLEEISRSLASWKAWSGGLLVKTPSIEDEEREEWWLTQSTQSPSLSRSRLWRKWLTHWLCGRLRRSQ
jgi:hypothetical protein